MGFISDVGQLAGGSNPNVGMGFGMPPQNYEPTQATQANPNLGLGFGMPSGDNPIYGQQSPFQPPAPNVGMPPQNYESTQATRANPNLGLGTPAGDMGNIGFGKGIANPALDFFGMPSQNYESTQATRANPNLGLGFNMPLQGNPLQGAPANAVSQLAGPLGAVGPALNAMNRRGGQMPGGAVTQPGRVIVGPQQFRGGLRPAPANYRPPMRRMR